MNYNPFELIARWLNASTLSYSEKRHMKMTLLEYVAKHPATAPLVSPYSLRTLALACASLVLVLGTSVGITQASFSALPGNKLYAVKIWIEEFQGKNQKTPEALLAFESARIEKRFNEAATLAANQSLDTKRAQIIQSGLEHSREKVRVATRELQSQNPSLALDATTNLETTFSSNAKILARVEQSTGVNVGPIVLAAEVATKTIGLEKMNIEKDLASLPDDMTKIAAESKYERLAALLPQEPEIATNEPVELERTTFATMVMTSLVENIEKNPFQQVMSEAREKMNQGNYSEALVLLEQAKQIVDTEDLTKKLETLYQVPQEITEEPVPQPRDPEPLENPMEPMSEIIKEPRL